MRPTLFRPCARRSPCLDARRLRRFNGRGRAAAIVTPRDSLRSASVALSAISPPRAGRRSASASDHQPAGAEGGREATLVHQVQGTGETSEAGTDFRPRTNLEKIRHCRPSAATPRAGSSLSNAGSYVMAPSRILPEANGEQPNMRSRKPCPSLGRPWPPKRLLGSTPTITCACASIAIADPEVGRRGDLV